MLDIYCFCMKTSDGETFAKCLTLKIKFGDFWKTPTKIRPHNTVHWHRHHAGQNNLRCGSQRTFTPCMECHRHTSPTWLQLLRSISCDTMRGQGWREHYLNRVTSIPVRACRFQTQIFMRRFLMLPPTGPTACETRAELQNHNILSALKEKLVYRRSRSWFFFLKSSDCH